MDKVHDLEIQELKELRKGARILQECLDRFVTSARAITGEEAEDGYTFDYILNDMYTPEELLERCRNEDVSNDPS